MDRTDNPFAPGAGTQPPELAGRLEILEEARVALGRVRKGNPARSQLLLGLRGVGKTVLLNRIEEIAHDEGLLTISIEAQERQGLASMLVGPLRAALIRMSKIERGKSLARKGLGALRSFAAMFEVQVGNVGFGVAATEGVADSGDLEADLADLLVQVGKAAAAADMPTAILIDEVQYLSKDDLGALIMALHRVGQRGLPVVVFGAGLPQLAGLAGQAKSYAERLFVYPDVGPLDPEAARDAVRVPIERGGARIGDDALDMIVERTQGYAYFLQEWGASVWDCATQSPVTVDDVDAASDETLRRLDESFFRVRLDRLTPRERDYIRAMAELGAGPHRSGDIAKELRIEVTSAGPFRSSLIRKGMVYAPNHGDTAFTVPMFDEFLRRAMPKWKPTAPKKRAKQKPRRKKPRRGR